MTPAVITDGALRDRPAGELALDPLADFARVPAENDLRRPIGPPLADDGGAKPRDRLGVERPDARDAADAVRAEETRRLTPSANHHDDKRRAHGDRRQGPPTSARTGT